MSLYTDYKEGKFVPKSAVKVIDNNGNAVTLCPPGAAKNSKSRNIIYSKPPLVTFKPCHGDKNETNQAVRSSKPVVSHMGKTTCKGCNESIDAGEYRVVWSAVELLPGREILLTPDEDEEPVRGDGIYASFCDQCAATAESFAFNNPWKELCEAKLRLALAPAPSDYKDFEEYVSSQQLDLTSRVVKTSDKIRRRTLANFLKDRSSRAMKPRMKQAVTLYVQEHTQSEIARKLEVDQATVSRMINAALGAAL